MIIIKYDNNFQYFKAHLTVLYRKKKLDALGNVVQKIYKDTNLY